MAKVLNKMLINATQLGLFRGVAGGVKAVIIFHLQFEHATLIFSEVVDSYLGNVKRILFSLESFLGLTVNYNKLCLIVLG